MNDEKLLRFFNKDYNALCLTLNKKLFMIRYHCAFDVVALRKFYLEMHVFFF
jgi:hypothetical protein